MSGKNQSEDLPQGSDPADEDQKAVPDEDEPSPASDEDLLMTFESGSAREREAEPDEDLEQTVVSPLPTEPTFGQGPGDTIILSPRERVDEIGWLVVPAGRRRGTIFRLDSLRNDIGRDRGVKIFVNDQAVSGLHATVKCEKPTDSQRGEFLIYDLASGNGTFVNGDRISAATVLKDGDTIRVGQTEFIFKRL
jgi:hypothetical protein